MIKNPLVSVIISAYNVEKYIREAIHSVLTQNYENLEVIIADDASTDNTRSVIDGIDDPRIKRFHNTSNLGYLATWNKLLPLTSGDYITFQDGDDASLPGRIEKLVYFLESNPEVGLCGSNFIRYFQPWGLYLQSNYPLSDAAIREEFTKEVVPFNGTRVMIRRNVYFAVGGFREYFKGLTAEDYDWILRIAEKFEVANIPDILYEYRYFPRSASKFSFESTAERLFLIKTVFFLAKQRKENGTDALQEKQPEQISEFLFPYQQELLKDTQNYMVYNRVFSSGLANKDFLYVWKLWLNRFKKYPFAKTNFYDFYRMFFGLFRTLIKAFYFKISGRSIYPKPIF